MRKPAAAGRFSSFSLTNPKRAEVRLVVLPQSRLLSARVATATNGLRYWSDPILLRKTRFENELAPTIARRVYEVTGKGSRLHC